MKRLCAWCGRPLGEPSSTSDDRWITHGICEDCLKTVLAEMGVPMSEFLDSLPQPVILVDGDAVVLDINSAARDMTGDGDLRTSRFLGEVFECVNASKPGGCGRTVHCSGCAIRRTVERTFDTGESQRRVPATLTVRSEDDPEEVALYITTEKVGGRVLLRVDPRTDGS